MRCRASEVVVRVRAMLESYRQVCIESSRPLPSFTESWTGVGRAGHALDWASALADADQPHGHGFAPLGSPTALRRADRSRAGLPPVPAPPVPPGRQRAVWEREGRSTTATAWAPAKREPAGCFRRGCR